MRFSPCQKGFSIVELASVLAIISLLLGAVIVGRSLYENANSRTIITEVREYQTAISLFVSQYDGLPGDLFEAQEFWPDSNVIGGDGNGSIDYQGFFSDNEMLGAWEQLSLAGMLEVNLTNDIDGGRGDRPVVGVNIPESRYQSTREVGAYMIFGINPFRMNTPNNPFNIVGGPEVNNPGGFSVPVRLTTGRVHFFQIGAYVDTASIDDTTLRGPMVTLKSSRFIDAKLDDESAGDGNVLSACDFTDDAGDVERRVSYNIEADEVVNLSFCRMQFRTQIE